jgi:hypothetical protein
MITLKEKDQEKIAKIRRTIKEFHKKEEELITQIAKDYGWAYESPEWLVLWDHVVNNCDWMVEFEKDELNP